MFKKLLLSPVSEIKRVFKTDDSRFILSVGIKISGISLAITLVIHWFLFQIMRLNYAFFKAHGFPEFSEGSPFYDSIITEAIDMIPILFAFHVFLFFIGVYVGWLMLRPFRTMGDYCETVLGNQNAIYRVDQFSTYRLLTGFSEFFFEYLRESRKRNQILTNSIPPQYSKIHKPVFDKIFMFHFGFLMVIIAISSAVFIIENSSSVYMSLVELATRTLADQESVSRYFSEQMFVLNEIVGLTIILIAFSYILLGFHLYAKVSGAAFGIFSTMRSFMKGNYSSRVHLVGYAHIRECTRKLNKYLDYIQNNLAKEQIKK
jgi:flagellar biosynthesis protein FlhB